MVDIMSKRQRSKLMGRIRSKGTSPERSLARALRREGLRPARYRGPGKADFMFAAARVAVFVDGCFWHGCPAHYRRPSSNSSYWSWKRAYNRRRDRQTDSRLRGESWVVLRIWEHSLPRGAVRFARRAALLVRRRTQQSGGRLRTRAAEARRSRSA